MAFDLSENQYADKILYNLNWKFKFPKYAKVSKRRLLMDVSNNIVLYGSEIWVEKLNIKKRAHSLISVKRATALRITSTYRTGSSPAILVIVGIIPVDLLAAERLDIY